MRFKILKTGVIIIAVITLSLAALVSGKMILNVTPSYPLGLYGTKPAHNLQDFKNQLVLICSDLSNPIIKLADQYKILPPGQSCPESELAPLLKRLVGVPGDQVAITNQGITINGHKIENSKIKYKFFEQMIHPGVYTLKSNEYWVMSSYNADSFDSRYFGPVKRQQIIRRVYPLLTIKTQGMTLPTVNSLIGGLKSS